MQENQPAAQIAAKHNIFSRMAPYMSWIFLVLVGIDPRVFRLGGEIVSHNTTDAHLVCYPEILFRKSVKYTKWQKKCEMNQVVKKVWNEPSGKKSLKWTKWQRNAGIWTTELKWWRFIGAFYLCVIFQGDIGLNVAKMIAELIRDNQKIVDRISQEQIELFVGLLKLNKVTLFFFKLYKNFIFMQDLYEQLDF